MPDQDELESELEQLIQYNETLMRENELFESYLQRANPARETAGRAKSNLGPGGRRGAARSREQRAQRARVRRAGAAHLSHGSLEREKTTRQAAGGMAKDWPGPGAICTSEPGI